MARHWLLEPGLRFLNHGSFGATPVPVLDAQSAWRERMERDPVRFLGDELETELDRARERLAAFLGASPADLVFVPNATTGINTVLRSLEPDLQPGDELLTTDHEYNATLNALEFVARRRGARVVICAPPFPPRSADDALDAVLDAASPRTRIALVSHVTSATAVVFPIERIVAALAERGIDTLVDAAHAVGMVALDLRALGAAYVAGNGHKWLCAPKGSGFLVVRGDRHDQVRPLVISHGANSPARGRHRLWLEADWTGTADPSALLSLPAAIDFMATLHPGGWPGLIAANRDLLISARDEVAAALGLGPVPADALVSESLLGSMAALPLPSDLPPMPLSPVRVDPDETVADDPLHDDLLARDRIQIPVYTWPPTATRSRRTPTRLLRLSAQRYNDIDDYRALGRALTARLVRPPQ